MPQPQLSVVHDPDEALLQPVLKGLHRYGVEEIGGVEPKKVAVLLPLAGRTGGGVIGHEVKRIFYVSHLWVTSEERGRGHGGRRLAAIEAEAFAMGCAEVRLDTMNARSIPFYKRNGYEAYALVPEYIPGFDKVFLRKINKKVNMAIESDGEDAAPLGWR
jgi:GNAT superfamily N-acetyltransferase